MKSILVNLAAGHDVAGEYAVSVAAAFDAHVLGVVFAYVPTIRRSVAHTTQARLIEEQRQASEAAAQAAAARFDAAARRAGASAASHVFTATLPGAPDIFGPLARRFDLALVGQPEPSKVAPEDLIIEAALFDSGRPVIVVPYIHKAPFKLDRVLVAWDGSRIGGAGIAVADTILNHAADSAADLIVMGGYGRSRLREFVLGGTTRAMLTSMTTPVLMSH